MEIFNSTINPDDLKDPNKRISVANVDYEIAKLVVSTKKLGEELRNEKDLESEDSKKTFALLHSIDSH